MPIIRKIQPKISTEKPKKRVAAYARVSKKTDRLKHSMAAQVSHYSAFIQSNPEWEYAGVYADAFITGTIAEKRDRFQELVSDCDAGKIDLVLVKSISRFARNTVDLLQVTRHLKDIGVEVYFERERISSLSADGELMLSILASLAQDESRSMSENIRWAFQKMYEKGKPHYRFPVLGYDWEGDKLIINKYEAMTVRRIFREYLAGVKLEKIAEGLYADGRLSINGNKISSGEIWKILRNPIYMGDMLCQKTFITDPISKVSKKNEGELPQYYISDFCDPIVDKDTFKAVKAEQDRRHMFMGEWRVNFNSVQYALSGKIKCGCCGRSFARKIRTPNKNGTRTVYWYCESINRTGVNCANSRSLPQSVITYILCEELKMDVWDEQTVVDRVDKIIVPEHGRVVIHLKTGETIERTWENTGRLDSWQDDDRKRNLSEKIRKYHIDNALFGDLITCGEPVRRYTDVIRDDTIHFWKCRNKELGRKQEGIREEMLKRILTETLGLEGFDIEKVKEAVESLTLYPDRRFTILTKEGKTIKIRIGGRNSGYSYEDTGEA